MSEHPLVIAAAWIVTIGFLVLLAMVAASALGQPGASTGPRCVEHYVDC